MNKLNYTIMYYYLVDQYQCFINKIDKILSLTFEVLKKIEFLAKKLLNLTFGYIRHKN